MQLEKVENYSIFILYLQVLYDRNEDPRQHGDQDSAGLTGVLHPGAAWIDCVGGASAGDIMYCGPIT